MQTHEFSHFELETLSAIIKNYPESSRSTSNQEIRKNAIQILQARSYVSTFLEQTSLNEISEPNGQIPDSETLISFFWNQRFWEFPDIALMATLFASRLSPLPLSHALEVARHFPICNITTDSLSNDQTSNSQLSFAFNELHNKKPVFIAINLDQNHWVSAAIIPSREGYTVFTFDSMAAHDIQIQSILTPFVEQLNGSVEFKDCSLEIQDGNNCGMTSALFCASVLRVRAKKAELSVKNIQDEFTSILTATTGDLGDEGLSTDQLLYYDDKYHLCENLVNHTLKGSISNYSEALEAAASSLSQSTPARQAEFKDNKNSLLSSYNPVSATLDEPTEETVNAFIEKALQLRITPRPVYEFPSSSNNTANTRVISSRPFNPFVPTTSDLASAATHNLDLAPGNFEFSQPYDTTRYNFSRFMHHFDPRPTFVRNMESTAAQVSTMTLLTATGVVPLMIVVGLIQAIADMISFALRTNDDTQKKQK